MPSSLVQQSQVAVPQGARLEGKIRRLACTQGHKVSPLWKKTKIQSRQVPLFHVSLSRSLCPTRQSLLTFPFTSLSDLPAPKIWASTIRSPPNPNSTLIWVLSLPSSHPQFQPSYSAHTCPRHLSHFPELPLQDHTNTLWSLLTRSCSTQHHLQGAAPWLLYPSLFLSVSAKAATLPPSSSAPASRWTASFPSLLPMLWIHVGPVAVSEISSALCLSTSLVTLWQYQYLFFDISCKNNSQQHLA